MVAPPAADAAAWAARKATEIVGRAVALGAEPARVEVAGELPQPAPGRGDGGGHHGAAIGGGGRRWGPAEHAAAAVAGRPIAKDLHAAAGERCGVDRRQLGQSGDRLLGEGAGRGPRDQPGRSEDQLTPSELEPHDALLVERSREVGCRVRRKVISHSASATAVRVRCDHGVTFGLCDLQGILVAVQSD